MVRSITIIKDGDIVINVNDKSVQKKLTPYDANHSGEIVPSEFKSREEFLEVVSSAYAPPSASSFVKESYKKIFDLHYFFKEFRNVTYDQWYANKLITHIFGWKWDTNELEFNADNWKNVWPLVGDRGPYSPSELNKRSMALYLALGGITGDESFNGWIGHLHRNDMDSLACLDGPGVISFQIYNIYAIPQNLRSITDSVINDYNASMGWLVQFNRIQCDKGDCPDRPNKSVDIDSIEYATLMLLPLENKTIWQKTPCSNVQKKLKNESYRSTGRERCKQ